MSPLDEALGHLQAAEARIRAALDRIDQSGGVDGSHHKQWVLDQVVRLLLGHEDRYWDWVRNRQAEGSDWSPGIPP